MTAYLTQAVPFPTTVIFQPLLLQEAFPEPVAYPSCSPSWAVFMTPGDALTIGSHALARTPGPPLRVDGVLPKSGRWEKLRVTEMWSECPENEDREQVAGSPEN
jgi:hypothetical protein